MNDVLIGGYIDENSVIHKLGGKIKLLCFVLMILYTLIFKGYVSVIINILIITAVIFFSKLKVKNILSFIKRMWLFFLIIIVMNALFLKSDDYIFSMGFISISKAGLLQGLQIVINVALVIIWSNILISITSPLALMDAISFYLSPLRLIKIPTEEITLILSVSMQFVPILLNEANAIKKAQIARGADFNSKNILKKAKCILPLIVPVFLTAFKRADELSQAMEARGYRGGN